MSENTIWKNTSANGSTFVASNFMLSATQPQEFIISTHQTSNNLTVKCEGLQNNKGLTTPGLF